MNERTYNPWLDLLLDREHHSKLVCIYVGNGEERKHEFLMVELIGNGC